MAIAYLIRGLQYVQAKITPPQNKQLAVLAAAEEPVRAPAETDAADESFRVLLLPSSSYAGGNNGRGKARPRKPRKAASGDETVYKSASAPARPSGRLRDVVTGETSVAEYSAVAGAPRPGTVRPSSIRSSSSLLDRLSTVDNEEQAETEGFSSMHEETDLTRRSFRLFKSMRN